MKTDEFDYPLPDEKIAQYPAAVRDECKLLVMDKTTGIMRDHVFKDISDYVTPGDVLVVNETRVLPARILGTKKDTGGSAEVFLLHEDFSHGKRSNDYAIWEALVRPGRRLKPGAIIEFFDEHDSMILKAEILDWSADSTRGGRSVGLSTPLASVNEALSIVGNTPLPPYIKEYTGNKELYQTVYSKREKSAAAPTAGLHFTNELIDHIKDKGVLFETVELQVGLDTFRIIEEDDPQDHHIHTETYSVPQRTIDAIEAAQARNSRIIAVGTTSVRCLESAWDQQTQSLVARNEEPTSLYILPGYTFNVVDSLITNFHVPRSTLLMLVSALSTQEHIMNAYTYALENNYRFLSFGDAMFIQ